MKRILITLLPLMALTACSGKDSSDTEGTTGLVDSATSSTTTTGSDTETDPTGTDTTDESHDTSVVDSDLYGEYPSNPLSVPEFTATNYDGTSRTRADLDGHYTIMWFYPLAGTAG